MNCNFCQAVVEVDSLDCKSCGATHRRLCQHCKKPNPIHADRCESCGADTALPSEPKPVEMDPPGSTGTLVLRAAGVLIVLMGLISGLGEEHFLAGAMVIITHFVMAALLIVIAQIRDLAHETWKKVNRLEQELSNRPPRP
jgi:hypothetical protein